jgi:hypothetical protein
VLAMSNRPDNPKDDIVADLSRGIQITNKRSQTRLVKMVADCEQLNNSGELLWERPPVE